MKMTMAQALLRFLDNQYVEFDGVETKFVHGVFGIFGHGCVVGLGEALEAYRGDIRFYQGRNEQGMALAAMAFAKQSRRRKIIACTSSIGPGAMNMVTAAACASVNRIPLLLLPGDAFASRQPDPVLQQLENPHSAAITCNDAFKPVSKYWDRVERPEQLMTAMLNALRVLTDPAATGAVTVAIPQDVQAMSYDYPEEFFRRRVWNIDRRMPSERALAAATEIIANAKKPLIVCGGGVLYSEAGVELGEFSEKFNIPFGETQAGKSAVSWKHPNNLGGIGVTGNAAANAIAKEADVVIGIGTRFSDFTTASKSLFANPAVQFVAINVNSYDGHKLDSSVNIEADARMALRGLTAALISKNYRAGYAGEIAAVQAAWETELQRLYSRKCENGFAQTEAIGVIAEMLNPQDIAVGSSGSLPGDLQRVWRSEQLGTYHMEYGFSTMGYEVNGAFGAKLAAEPTQEVYTFVGDGSFQMAASDLFTSLQENAKIIVLLFDNWGFGCINNLQCAMGIGSFGTEFRYRNEQSGRMDGEYIPTDYAKIAEGMGVIAYRATNAEELRAALIAAKQQTRSTLIDIKVLPKTMTDGYGAWWHVGVPECNAKNSVLAASGEMKAGLAKARKY